MRSCRKSWGEHLNKGGLKEKGVFPPFGLGW